MNKKTCTDGGWLEGVLHKEMERDSKRWVDNNGEGVHAKTSLKVDVMIRMSIPC